MAPRFRGRLRWIRSKPIQRERCTASAEFLNILSPRTARGGCFDLALSVFAAIAVGLCPADAATQAAYPDTVSGRVMSPDSTPIVVAHVIIVSGDDRRDSTLTDSSGRYLLVMPGDSGICELRVRAFGYHQLSTIVQRDTADSDRSSGVMSRRIIRDIVLNPVAVVLEPVTVTGSRIRFGQQNAIDTREDWASFLAEKLPVDVSGFDEI